MLLFESCYGLLLLLPAISDFVDVSVKLQSETPEETTYIGTKGTIRLLTPAHAPVKVVIKKVWRRTKHDASMVAYVLVQPYIARCSDESRLGLI